MLPGKQCDGCMMMCVLLPLLIRSARLVVACARRLLQCHSANVIGALAMYRFREANVSRLLSVRSLPIVSVLCSTVNVWCTHNGNMGGMVALLWCVCSVLTVSSTSRLRLHR